MSSDEPTNVADSAATHCYAFCPLNTEQRAALRAQIDVGTWKHSWHLPITPGGYTDWNRLDTMTKIRDVLVDQITEAKNQLREAERCLAITVNAMIRMERDNATKTEC